MEWKIWNERLKAKMYFISACSNKSKTDQRSDFLCQLVFTSTRIHNKLWIDRETMRHVHYSLQPFKLILTIECFRLPACLTGWYELCLYASIRLDTMGWAHHITCETKSIGKKVNVKWMHTKVFATKYVCNHHFMDLRVCWEKHTHTRNQASVSPNYFM